MGRSKTELLVANETGHYDAVKLTATPACDVADVVRALKVQSLVDAPVPTLGERGSW